MTREPDRSKNLDMLGALNSPGYREETKRRKDRNTRSLAQKLRKVQPTPIPSDPLDLSDVSRWKSRDFINYIRAVGRALGVPLWCDERRQDGEYATSIVRLNMDMRDLLGLLECSGIGGKRRQATFLRLWLESWDEFMRAEPSARRVGFAPRYWMAAWKKIFPQVRTMVQAHAMYAEAAMPIKSEAKDAVMERVRVLYPDWPDDPELEEGLTRLLGDHLPKARREIHSILYQNRLSPKYAALWTALKSCRKA